MTYLRHEHKHDFFVDGGIGGDVGTGPAGSNATHLEFGAESDEDVDFDNDEEYLFNEDECAADDKEFESLFQNRPRRLNAAEGRRRASRSTVAVVLGCGAFVYGSIRLRDIVNPRLVGSGDGSASVEGPATGRDDALPPFWNVSHIDRPLFKIGDDVLDEFRAWSEFLQEDTGMGDYTGGEPDVNWDWHPRERRDRFPSVDDRVKYYMGEFYDASVPMHGTPFLTKSWGMQRSTRKFGLSSSFTINLFNFSIEDLKRCNKEEDTVLHAYCRDYVDFAILHSECTANTIWHLGDSLPKTSFNKLNVKGYPVINKVRNFCTELPHFEKVDLNPNCLKKDNVSTIIWPLNRHRHLSPAAKIGDVDVSWEKKAGKMMWRGGMNDAFGAGRKWNLVAQHVNSTLVDAKFAKRENKRHSHGDQTEDIPEEFLGPFIDQATQLKNKYLVSIEGNDVSSGFKWMLFSNSLVFIPPTTFESWAMEGILKPFVHYIPLKSDMSNVEEMIRWAESNPEEAQRIAQRSTLFIYDLLFHPDALHDEQLVLQGIVEKYEQNFGYSTFAPIVHPITHIHKEWHPQNREDRFPSIMTRIEYYMGKWFHGAWNVSMQRKDENLLISQFDSVPLQEVDFVASGEVLTTCAARRKHDDNKKLNEYCNEALPFFDERILHDIVSTRHPDEDPSFKLTPITEDMKKSHQKWFKRILIDNSYKLIRFGDSVPDHNDVPVFAKIRAAETKTRDTKSQTNNNMSVILWWFDENNEYDLVRSGLVERLDTPFNSKMPRAVWRGGIGSRESSSPEVTNRKNLVGRSIGSSADEINARFIMPDDWLDLNKKGEKELLSKEMMIRKASGDEDKALFLQYLLSFKYVIATEDDYRINSDLKWMFLSQSVVLMPPNLRFASWFLEDTMKPYVHFVPIKTDYSDVEDQIAWCEGHLQEIEQISERATLFVHDMLFQPASEKDNDEIRLQIMERYGTVFHG